MFLSLIAETLEEPGAIADTGMPTAAPPATPIAPVSAIPTALVSVVPSVPISTLPTGSILTGPDEFLFPYLLLHFFLVSLSFLDHGFSYHALCFMLSLLLIVLSQFEVGNSFVTVPNPMSEAATFFTRFDQPEVNDLDPIDFWGFGPPYVDFHGFWVPKVVLLIWWWSTVAVVTLCKDFALAVLPWSTS